jgi:general stress protein 26
VPKSEPGVAEVEQAITELLRNEEIGTVATLSADGYPSAATMHFAAEGLVVYLHTYTYTRKFEHIQANPRIGYALAYVPPEGFDGRLQVRALQVMGTATIVTEQDEIDRAVELSHQQFDWLSETAMYENFKRANRTDRQVFIRVDPVKGLWTDNRVRMLWRRLVTFTPDGRHVAELAPYDESGGVVVGAGAASS